MRHWTLFAFATLLLLPTRLFAAADAITIGSATADTTLVEVPISIRDVAGTPLGVDQPAGAHIQAIAFKVKYDPTKIASIRLQFADLNGGVLFGLNPLFSSIPRTPDSISFLASYNENEAPIPFVVDAPPPGNLTAVLVITLQPGLAEGDRIPLTLDEAATSLSNQAGAISESKGSGTLELNNGEVVIGAPRPPRRIVPAVASAPGLNGAFFRTMVQIANPSATAVIGRIVFHPEGVTASSSDPSIDYVAYAHQTVQYDDLLPAMGVSGVGTVDVIADTGPLPTVIARIFDDAGANGTTGMYEDTYTESGGLTAGDQGILVAPSDPVKSRFNIGFRTLDRDAKMTITVRNKNGTVMKTLSKSVNRNLFVQTSAKDLLGIDLGPSDMIVFDMLAGNAIIYGSTVDNTTQDPSWQAAWKVSSVSAKTFFGE